MTTLPEKLHPQVVDVVTTQSQRSTMDMVSDALARGAPIELVERLLGLHERWEAGQAKKAFIEAKTAFKAEAPLIIKDRENSQYKSQYASIGNLVNTTNEVLSRHGLDASWDIDQSDKVIKVTCILKHVLGHSESVSMIAPPDTTGSKNPIQQIKSATTYLKVATYEAVTGIASNEANRNDDGNAAYEKKELESKFKDEIPFFFLPGSPAEGIHFKNAKARCLDFINEHADNPDMLVQWFESNRRVGIRQLHNKLKGDSVAIARRLDEVVAAAKPKEAAA